MNGVKQNLLSVSDSQSGGHGAKQQSIHTENRRNSYLCRIINMSDRTMIKKIRELYNDVRPYVRVDLIMYGVMILLIVLYLVVSTFI